MPGTRQSKAKPPLVTIVTVVRNAAAELERTIKSVIHQTYAPIEYIIIDGGSTDGTLNIIKKFEEHIDFWVSEKDNGVYDGMNKAIEKASGEWIHFLNAGDWFYAPDVIKNVFSDYPGDVDLLYGDYIFLNPEGNLRAVKALPPDCLWQKMPFSHQSLFTKIEIMKKYKFDPAYRIAADYHFIYQAYANNHPFFYTGHTICVYSSGGLSIKNQLRSMLERWRIAKKFGDNRKFQIDRLHIKLFLKNIFKKKRKIKNSLIPKYIWKDWYPIEHDHLNWWCWTKKSGTIMVLTDEEKKCNLYLELCSVKKPNKVDIKVNERSAAAVEVNWQGFKAIPPVPLTFTSGFNKIEFISQKEPVIPSAGHRLLAIAVKNLKIE